MNDQRDKTNAQLSYQLRQLRRRIERVERALRIDESRPPSAENIALGEHRERAESE